MNAVIWAPTPHIVEASVVCLAYARATGYHIEGIVHDQWENVMDLIQKQVVQVVIAAERHHIPRDREPRIEIVAEESIFRPIELDPTREPARQRRPRRIG